MSGGNQSIGSPDTTLIDAVDDTITTWNCSLGSGATLPTDYPYYLKCEDEIVRCTNRSSGVFTVSRGFASTTPASHIAGSVVLLQALARKLSNMEALEGTSGTPSTDNKFVTNSDSRINMLRVVTTSQFDKTNDAALANVTGLSLSIVTGKTYQFRAVLFVDANGTGGHQYAVSGTATASSIKYQVNAISNTTNLNVINSRQTALGGAVGQAGATTVYT